MQPVKLANFNSKALKYFERLFSGGVFEGSVFLYYNCFCLNKLRCPSCGNLISSYVQSDPLVLLDEDKEFALPIFIQKREEDGSLFCTLPMDLNIPNQEFIYKQCEPYVGAFGLAINKEARPEVVINLRDSFETHSKELHRIYRQYKKTVNKFRFDFKQVFNSKDLLYAEADLNPYYYSYWASKGDVKSWDFEMDYLYCLADCGQVYTCSIYDGNKLIAVAYFIRYVDELYWIQTKRNTDAVYEKDALGNCLIMHALKNIYDKKWNIPLNLGIGWLDYKQIWNPEFRYKSGFDVVNNDVFSSIPLVG